MGGVNSAEYPVSVIARRLVRRGNLILPSLRGVATTWQSSKSDILFD